MTQQSLNWQTIIKTTGQHTNLTTDFSPTRNAKAPVKLKEPLFAIVPLDFVSKIQFA